MLLCILAHHASSPWETRKVSNHSLDTYILSKKGDLEDPWQALLATHNQTLRNWNSNLRYFLAKQDHYLAQQKSPFFLNFIFKSFMSIFMSCHQMLFIKLTHKLHLRFLSFPIEFFNSFKHHWLKTLPKPILKAIYKTLDFSISHKN